MTEPRVVTYGGAILEAITEAMDADPYVVVLGDSVADPKGTRGSTGLVERFGPSRVIGTPLSEASVTGAAIGMALAGMRPLQVHIRVDFSMLGMDPLVNFAAKVRSMYGGALGGVPLTVRLSIGRSWGQGAQHSQGLQSLFAHIPGLRVVMPSTPADAKGAMAWALQKSQDPVVFIDHRMLHKTTGPAPATNADAAWNSDPKSGWRRIEKGVDLTIVAISYMALEARRAVAILQKLGVSCSLIDPMWIRPLPCLTAVITDVSTTGRLLVVDCGWPSFGVSAEIVTRVAERTPIERVARMGLAETACPTSRALEHLYYPNVETIAAKAYEMVTGEKMPEQKNGTAPEVAGFRGPF